MRKVLLWVGAAAGLAVLGLLAASAFASLSALGTLAAPASPPPPPVDPILARAEPAARSPAPSPVPVAAPVAPPPAEARRQPLQPPPDQAAWEGVPRLQRTGPLGRAGADLEKGLGKLHADLAPCFGQGQVGYASQPVTGAENPEADDPGSPVFTLQVSFANGTLRVEDAPVEVRSSATDATLACLQARLRGVQIRTDAVPKVPRFRIRYNVFP